MQQDTTSRCSNIINVEYGRQFIQSSLSPAAYYIEASETLGQKDFFNED